jgi:alpha-ribazole phosphatase
MELALIRHTRCDIAAGTCYGHLDVPLAATAAADIALTLSRVPPVELVFSSPSRRCHTLAQALALRDACEIRVSHELRELHFGAWEGQLWSDIPRATSDEWATDPWNIAPPGGESESALWQRVSRVAEDLRKLCETQRIAVVSHGGPLRHLRCQLTGTPASERWQWTCNWGDVAFIAPRESAFPSSGP